MGPVRTPSMVLQFVVLAITIRTSTAADCTDLVPGIKKMFLGVDLTSLDFFSTNNNGLKGQIIQLTCEEGKKYKGFDQPDQVAQVIESHAGGSQEATQMFNSTKDVKAKLMAGAAGDASMPAVAQMSFSASYVDMEDSLNQHNKVIYERSSATEDHTVTMQFSGAIQLDPEASAFLARLAGDYNSQRDDYIQFFSQYGTHYLSKGSFGGKIRQTHKLDRNLVTHMNKHEINAHLKASYYSISASANLDKSKNQNYKNFENSDESKTDVFGGDNSLILDRKDQKGWMLSVVKHPWLLSGTVTPIYDAIKDDKVKAWVKDATRRYGIQRFLEAQKKRIKKAIRTVDKSSVWMPNLKEQLQYVNTDLVNAKTSKLSEYRCTEIQEKVDRLLENSLKVSKLKCGKGWTRKGKFCYRVGKDDYDEYVKLEWEEAKENCELIGGYLAMPKTAKKIEAMQSFDVHDLWIGLSDKKDEGKFVWVKGDTLKDRDANWMHGEPNNSHGLKRGLFRGQDCVMMNGDGKWADKDCTKDDRNFICEKDAH